MDIFKLFRSNKFVLGQQLDRHRHVALSDSSTILGRISWQWWQATLDRCSTPRTSQPTLARTEMVAPLFLGCGIFRLLSCLWQLGWQWPKTWCLQCDLVLRVVPVSALVWTCLNAGSWGKWKWTPKGGLQRPKWGRFEASKTEVFHFEIQHVIVSEWRIGYWWQHAPIFIRTLQPVPLGH